MVLGEFPAGDYLWGTAGSNMMESYFLPACCTIPLMIFSNAKFDMKYIFIYSFSIIYCRVDRIGFQPTAELPSSL